MEANKGTIFVFGIIIVLIICIIVAITNNNEKATTNGSNKEGMNKIVEHRDDRNGPMFSKFNRDDPYDDDDLTDGYKYVTSSDVLANILGDGIDSIGRGDSRHSRSHGGKYEGGLNDKDISGLSENKKKYNLLFNDFQNDILVDPLETSDVAWTEGKMSGKDFNDEDLLNLTRPSGVQYLMNDKDMFHRDASVMAAGSATYVDDHLLPTKEMTNAEWKANLERNVDNGPLNKQSFQYQAFYPGQPDKGFTDSNPQMQFNPKPVYERQPTDVFLNTPKSFLPILEKDSYQFPNQYVPNESLNLSEEDQYMMECAAANGCNRDYLDTFNCMNEYQHRDGLDRDVSV
jgi:hypothetical protein